MAARSTGCFSASLEAVSIWIPKKGQYCAERFQALVHRAWPKRKHKAPVLLGQAHQVLQMCPDTTPKACATPKRTFEEVYHMEEEAIGEGGFGSVHKCRAKDLGSAWMAAKTISKLKENGQRQPKGYLDRIQSEVRIMKQLNHPNVVPLHEVFEDARRFYLVMPLCPRDLFEEVNTRGKMTEQAAAHCLQQMLAAVRYMHANGVMHRDLKLENWLLEKDTPAENCCLKLTDFGCAKYFPGQFFADKAGTRNYVAPEVIEGHYNELCDLWSVGVTLYILLKGGEPKFLSLRQEDWLDRSQDALHMLRILLKKDLTQRSSAEGALKAPWLSKVFHPVSICITPVVSATEALDEFKKGLAPAFT